MLLAMWLALGGDASLVIRVVSVRVVTVEVFLEKKTIEVEIAISYPLEIELSYKRRDSYTRQYLYLPEDSGIYERIRRPKQKKSRNRQTE